MKVHRRRYKIFSEIFSMLLLFTIALVITYLHESTLRRITLPPSWDADEDVPEVKLGDYFEGQ